MTLAPPPRYDFSVLETRGQLDFFENIRERKIPEDHPATVYSFGQHYIYMFKEFKPYYHGRDYLTDRGMWAVVYMKWVRKLAEWIDGRSVLEIMGGAGWLSRALSDSGVSVTCTDNYSWDDRHEKIDRSVTGRMYDVIPMEAEDAIREYGRLHDIVLCSWPYHRDDTIVRIAELIPQKPFVYIGEAPGNCCAPREFYEVFTYDDKQPVRDIFQWYGMHDEVSVGRIE